MILTILISKFIIDKRFGLAEAERCRLDYDRGATCSIFFELIRKCIASLPSSLSNEIIVSLDIHS